MKTHHAIFFLPIVLILLLCQSAVSHAAPVDWTSADGRTIQAEFVKLEDEVVFIRRDGKEFSIPMAKLSLASRNQARAMAAEAPAPAKPVGAAQPKDFGKQNDPDHQRKLAESIIAKRGTVEVWKDAEFVFVSEVKNLPKGRIKLRAIDAVGTPFSDDDAVLLNGCGELIRLQIQRAVLEDMPLGSLTSLESLEFVDSNISVRALEGLRGHKSLRAFSLWKSIAPVGQGVVAILGSIPTLDYINLHQAGLEGDPLTPLTKLKNLRILHLGANKYSEEQLAVLADLPALEELFFGNSMLLDHSMAFLPSVKTLQRVWLNDSKLADPITASLGAMPSLTYLNLSGTNVSDAMLKGLGGNRSLRELHLVNIPATGNGFQGAKPLPSLARIELLGPQSLPDDSACAAIAAAAPNLSFLIVNARMIGPNGIQALKDGLRGIAALHLHDATGFDETAAATVVEMRALNDLAVIRANLTPALLSKLEPLKSRLRFLDVGGNPLGNASVELLSKFRALESLGITGTGITPDAIAKLQNELKSCRIIP